MNKVILIGRIGKDPELKTFQSGSQVLNFSLATSRKWKDKQGEWQEETSWHRCQVWGDRAGNMTYLGKGDLVACEGEIKYGQYDDKDGNTRYTTDIACHSVSRLQKNEPSGQANQNYNVNKGFGQAKKPEAAGPWSQDADDMPF